METFRAGLALGLAVALAASISWLRARTGFFDPQRVSGVAMTRAETADGLSALLPEPALDATTITPRRARARRQLFGARLGGVGGVGLDARRSSVLFSALFPGYPDSAREDSALWGAFFSHDFDARVQSELLSAPFPYGFAVMRPWLGCLDLYRRYGADVVIFGASDAGHALPPDMLARLLREAHLSGLSNPKVLTCSTLYMLPEVVDATASALLETGRRPRWVVYGYSPEFAHTRSPYYRSTLLGKLGALRAYRESARLAPIMAWSRPLQSPWSWDDVIPFQMTTGADLVGKAVQGKGERTRRKTMIDLPSSLVSGSERELAAYLKREAAGSVFIEDLDRAGCGDFAQASSRLRKTLRTLGRLGQRTLLFANPITDLELSGASDCFKRNEKKLIEAMRGSATVVDAAGMAEMGLGYRDYVFEQNTGGRFFLDTAHVNISGARKVSRRISRLMIRADTHGLLER